MPTALDVEVVDERTPPPNMKQKKSSSSDKKCNSEASKITPAPSTSKKKQQQQKAQQPSIMSFFHQNKVDTTKKDSVAKPSPVNAKQKDDSTATATLPTKLPTKPPAMPNVPTAQELRDIVFGTRATKNLDHVVVPKPTHDLSDDEDELLPVLHMPSPSRFQRNSTNKAPPPSPMRMNVMRKKENNEAEKLQGAVPYEHDSNVDLIAEKTHEMEDENAASAQPSDDSTNKEESEVEEASEKENKGLETDDEGDDDDETVDMLPVKQPLEKMANHDKKEVPQVITANESNKDTSDKDKKANHQVESGIAGESMDCVDLTQDHAPTAAESSAQKEGNEEPPPAEKSPAKSPDADDSKLGALTAEIASERKDALVKNGTLRAQYKSRLDELVQRAHDGLAEESFTLPALEPVETLPEEGTTVSSPSEFPDCAIRSLALLVQESRLPLSDLAATALIQLKDAYPDKVEFHAEGIATKIKLLATREPYVQVDNTRIVNAFEDENTDRMWCWEIVSLEILPHDVGSKIKKARTARRKLRAHSKALCLLLKYLDQANKLLLDPNSTQAKCDDIETKIINAEQKVLKYEREEEKARLAAEAKRQKEAAKKQDGKQKGKSAAEEQKEREKELKKQAAAKEREDKKREKEAKKQEKEAKKRKKEEEKQKEELEKAKKIKKQRTMMNSFFIQNKPKAKKPKHSKLAAKSTASVNSDDFWSRLNKSDTHEEGPMFPSLSAKAVASRKRRTRVVPVQVFATVMPANPFDTQPYAELQTIRVPNKYKFLRFCEDMRPPYHGTWSKTSSVVTGQNPFAKDTSCLDYEVDSEGEWEEGDDEVGEDCEDDGPDEEDNIEDEEGDTRMYNYEDGWLAADDDLGIDDDDVDEDTKLLLEKKRFQQKALSDQATICIIAPGKGGVPPDDISDELEDTSDRIEGVNPSAARDLLMQHTSRVLSSEGFCLDAFPPPLVEEGNLGASSPSGNKAASSNEMSPSNLITFVEFVHHSEFPSKERVLEELRMAHPTITSSRAQAARKLDCIAEKKRYPGGVYWEVRRETLEELGLEELMEKKFELPTPKPSSDKKTKASATSSSAKSTAPGTAKATKKKKASPKSDNTTPAATKAKTASSNESSSSKKRPAQEAANKASAQLFANFLNKKAKKGE